MSAASSLAEPRIDITKSRYDLTTYTGRLRHFIAVTSPLTLFHSKDSIRKAQQLVKDYSEGKVGNVDEATLWKAKQLVDSSVHPDTKEIVPLPFRMSAFVPTNIIICAGMLLPNPSMASVVFWQWMNQSLNVAVNFSNANKSTKLSNEEIAKSYAGATATSVGIAVGLNKLVPALKSLAPATRAIMARFIPFVSVASAGIVNITLMRWTEIKNGIDVYPPATPQDPKPASLGKSSKAGTIAIGQTAASRVLTNIPILILPPVIMATLQRRGAFRGPRGKAIEAVANIGLIGTSLLVFLPPAIATFPQRASVAPSSLEPKFTDLRDPLTQQPFKKLEFNRGL